MKIPELEWSQCKNCVAHWTGQKERKAAMPKKNPGQLLLFEEPEIESNMNIEMNVSLQIKKPSEFFWMRGIRDVDITLRSRQVF
jgi:hypothetical protein